MPRAPKPDEKRPDLFDTTDLADAMELADEFERADGPDAASGESRLPIVPVSDQVYFPEATFPLIVRSAAGIAALRDATLARPPHVVVATRREIVGEMTGADDLFEVGVVAKVTHCQELPDGSSRALLRSLRRVRLQAVEKASGETFFASVEPFDMPVASLRESARIDALARTITRQFEGLIGAGSGSERAIEPDVLIDILSADSPESIVNLIAPFLETNFSRKQTLLECADPVAQLTLLTDLLTREVEISDLQGQIRERAMGALDAGQREFFLREQLRAIQQELGETDGDLQQLRDAALARGLSGDAMERVARELSRLERMPPQSPEATVSRNYIDWLLALPWNQATTDSVNLPEAAALLETHHVGLSSVKDRLLEFLAARALAGERHRAPILCFAGPPGVGKTSVARSVASALGRNFARISLGGIRDDAEIRGHRRTYVGAQPGRIIQALRQAGSKNPVLLLDEIDKLGADFRSDPSAALLEALDPEQNASFSDHFVETTFDLSGVLFVLTANVLDTIPHALRDRLEVIEFSGYQEREKVRIAREHLLPRQRDRHGLAETDLVLTDETLGEIVRGYTREAGVRQLERHLAAICRKSARQRLERESDAPAESEPRIDATTLARFLGRRQVVSPDRVGAERVGATFGLVYTQAGGDIITIEAQPVPNLESGTVLTLTGSLGEIMRESGMAAWTFTRSRLKGLGVDPASLSGQEIHVHVPAGAVPKDGPSAGLAIAVALASAISGRAVRGDIAMTGEITLRGNVLPVGGILEKLLGAHRAGIKTVLIPAGNEPDLEDLPEDIRSDLEIIAVETADDALARALVDGS